MISSLTAKVVAKLTAAYYLSKSLNLGINGVWAAIALSVAVEALMISIYYKKTNGRRKLYSD